jgi:outer membrane protein OmpA-like peptidoglycan-associated protein
MAERTGKCVNYTKCTIAYRNQPISVDGDFVCPECGQPLHEIKGETARRKLNPMVAGGAALALLVLGIILFAVTRPGKTQPQAATVPSQEAAPTTPEPEPPIAALPPATPGTPPATATAAPTVAETTPTPAEPPNAEPAQPVVVEKEVNVDPQSAENKEIKQEVLKRIEAMPKPLTDAEKDKLYAHVDRARGMGRVITIPFGSAQTTLSAQNVAQLKAATQAPQIVTMVSDPTVVFVILGFADKQGDYAKNLEISRRRAASAMQALRDKCGFLNVMHPVGMGGSELFDTGDHARNRVVEVWAVLP